MIRVAPGVFRKLRQEEIVNAALCGMTWAEAMRLRHELLKAFQLRQDVEEIFREAQQKGRG